MKKVKVVFILVLIICFISSISLQALEGDWTGPEIRWMGPTENMCLNISASSPSIGIRVDAEDESGVRQGTIWLKKGHHTTIGGIETWSRIWGRTFATGTSAPPVISYSFMLRMAGRGEGEFTLMAEYYDMVAPKPSRSFLHFFTDTSSPTASIISPLNNSVLCKDKNLLVQISASDPGCGIKNVALFFDRVTKGGFIGRDSTSPYEIIVPKSRFTKGVHKLYAIAYDKAGKNTKVSIVIKPTRICLMRMSIKR